MKPLYFVMLLALASFFVNGQKSEIYQSNGFAIGGYDPVSFFTEQKAVKGDPKYVTEWKTARWLFSSQANLNSFLKKPEKYAPQYGGYCAYGLAGGHKAPTEAYTWTILNNKLYFNYNQNVKASWNKNTKKYIEQANNHWPLLKDQD